MTIFGGVFSLCYLGLSTSRTLNLLLGLCNAGTSIHQPKPPCGLGRLELGTLKGKKTKMPESSSAPTRSLNEKFSLISDSRSGGCGYHLICREYPTGDIELTSLKLTSDDSLTRGGGAVRENTDKSSMTAEVLQKSIRRARTQIRRRCLTMEANKLLTLTFRENITSVDEAWKKFKYFIKLMRWRYREFKYVAVPEYQKRGAVHFHLAVRGYYDFNTVRRLWLRAAGDSGGNVDFTSPRTKGGKIVKNPSRISAYISKYISKEDNAAFNRRRYSSGGEIKIPSPIYGWLALGDATVFILCSLVEKLTHAPVRRIWESEGRYPIIHIMT